MAKAGYSCKFDCAKELRWLRWIQEQVQGDSPAYDNVTSEAIDIITMRTRGGRDVDGAIFKVKKDGNPSYLHKGGEMLRSVRGSRSGTRITIVQDQPIYGAVHNFGLHAGRGKGFTMPLRKWFGLVKSDLMQLNDSLYNKLKSIFEKSVPR
jgi:phage gpG-like protein